MENYRELYESDNRKEIPVRSNIRSDFYSVGDGITGLLVGVSQIRDPELSNKIKQLDTLYKGIRAYLNKNYKWD